MLSGTGRTNFKALEAATPQRPFTLRNHAGPVADPRRLAQLKQRDRWRSEQSVLRSSLRNHGLAAVITLLTAALGCWLLVSPWPAIFLLPALWSLLRLPRLLWRWRQLEERMLHGRSALGPRRYQSSGRRWAWGRLPVGLRRLICLAFLIGGPLVAVWLGLLGWDSPRHGGVAGMVTGMVGIGLPGLAFGLGLWPVARRSA